MPETPKPSSTTTTDSHSALPDRPVVDNHFSQGMIAGLQDVRRLIHLAAKSDSMCPNATQEVTDDGLPRMQSLPTQSASSWIYIVAFGRIPAQPSLQA
jgi:hypothetical protein